jgi:hypothetical protein
MQCRRQWQAMMMTRQQQQLVLQWQSTMTVCVSLWATVSCARASADSCEVVR